MKSGAGLARDPYLAWTLATGLKGHKALANRPDDGFLPLLLRAPVSPYPGWRVPKHYRDGLGAGFWTAWVPAAAVDRLAELQVDCAMSLPLRDPPSKRPHREPPSNWKEKTPVIGVIDNGCAFLNQAFSAPGRPEESRFLGLWRQRPVAEAPAAWQVPADFGYGLELRGEDIHPAQGDEAKAYAELGYPLDEQGRLSDMLHGTHVLDIAAGLPQALPAAASAKPLKEDDACQAGLVFVELPQPLPDDTTGASLDAFILDAVHYVLRRAGPDRRVIINLSLGAQAGPHDGGSLVEQALDELIAAKGGRLSICVAAGNGAEEHWHARGKLSGSEEVSIGWRNVPGDTTDSFLELWATADAPSGLQGLSVGLTAPDGSERRARLGTDGPQLLYDDGGTPQASLDLRSMAQFDGQYRACALVSLAPTAGRRSGMAAGLWRLSIARPPGSPKVDCQLAFWLQRDTPGRSLEGVLQSELEGLGPPLAWDGEGALSNLAGARRVVTVGAARASDGRPSAYSPRDRVKVWATADESASVYGLLCSGGLSGSSFRISGTSAATPMAVRALANGQLSLPAPPALSGKAAMPHPSGPSHPPLIRPGGKPPGQMRLDQA